MKKQIVRTKHKSKTITVRVLIEQDEDGLFVVSAPSLPGCHTQGKTYEEALENIKKAISLCLEVAEENVSYKEKIDFEEDAATRFLGVANIPIQTHFSL